MTPRGLTRDLRLVIANVTPSPICVLLCSRGGGPPELKSASS